MSSNSNELRTYQCSNTTLSPRTRFIGAADEVTAGACNNNLRFMRRTGEEFSSKRSLTNGFWPSEPTSTVIYENICEGCQYGIFEADGRYCQFCQFLLCGQKQTPIDHIYENIGVECDRSSNSTESEGCLPVLEPDHIDAHVKSNPGLDVSERRIENSASKSHFSRYGWGNGVLADLFGSLKKVRLHEKGNKRRKLEIIHNANGAELFGEERDEWRIGNRSPIEVNGSKQVNCLSYNKHWGRQIYGKLRKSDDQLMNLLGAERETMHASQWNRHRSSQSDSNISSIGLGLRSLITVAPIDHYTVLNGNKREGEKASFALPVSSRSRANSFFMIQDNVVNWLTSLRTQTHDYCSYFVLDDSFSSIKSIPSAYFNCCGLLCGSATIAENAGFTIVTTTSASNSWLLHEEAPVVGTVSANIEKNCEDDDSLKSLVVVGANSVRVELMLDNFKRHLMEKRIRSKRRAIYVKVDESDECPDVNRNSVSGEGATGFANAVDGYTKRDAFHERNSDFVNDILIAFNTFLSRESESGDNSGDDSNSANNNGNTHTIAKCTAEVLSDNKNLPFTQHLRSQVLAGECQATQDCKQLGSVVASLVGAKYYRQCKVEILQLIFHRTDVPIASSKLRGILTSIALSKSLNRRLLIIDSRLRQFLHVVCSDPRLFKINRKKLIVMYNAATVMITPTSMSPQKKKVFPIDEKCAIASIDKSEENSDKGDVKNVFGSYDDEDIYQPIWKFRSVGNPRESYHSVDTADEMTTLHGSGYSTTAPNDSSSLSVEDLSDWETDDEFIFSLNHTSPRNRLLSHQQQPGKVFLTNKVPSRKNSPVSSPKLGERIRALKTSLLKPPSSSQSLASISSSYSADSAISSSTCINNVSPNTKRSRATKRKYQRVFILYSYEDPRLRAFIYNNDNYKSGHLNSQYDEERNKNIEYKSNKTSTSPHTSVSERLELRNGKRGQVQATNKGESKSSSTSQDFIPLCVQAWKFLLLDADYLDDEDDMYVSRHEILNSHREYESPPNTLKKCASEGNLLQLPSDKKKTLGERFMNKFQAVGIFPISPRQMKEKKKTDYLKRRGSIGPYISNNTNKALLFGSSLEEVRLSGSINVPEFVVDCINIIERPEYISTDGLYRASGNKVEMDLVKKSLTDKYDAKILENQDIHTITGLLKLFFRELKTALISDDVYNKLPNNLADKENLSCIKDVLYLMSIVSRDTLKYLIKHLTKVAAESHTNRMPASNLAIIWGPCILYSSFTNPMSIARINTLTKVLIEQYDIIFNDKDERLIW